MKIAIAGVAHETNTYCRGRTETKDFHQLPAIAFSWHGVQKPDWAVR